MRIKLIAIVIALVTNTALSQELFKCKRENGTIAYTDKPCENGLQKQGDSWMNEQEIDKLNQKKIN